jgi:alpha/beta hydrolase family protein
LSRPATATPIAWSVPVARPYAVSRSHSRSSAAAAVTGTSRSRPAFEIKASIGGRLAPLETLSFSTDRCPSGNSGYRDPHIRTTAVAWEPTRRWPLRSGTTAGSLGGRPPCGYRIPWADQLTVEIKKLFDPATRVQQAVRFPANASMLGTGRPAAAGKPHRVVLADLRGYGASAAPPGGPLGEGYTKREMAAELVRVMAELGHERFAVAGHDRGARVAYRMALDHPRTVTRLTVLNVIPTVDQFAQMSTRASLGY